MHGFVRLIVLALLCCGWSQHASAQKAQMEVLKTLRFQKGDVVVGNNLATLRLTPEFRYLDPADTQMFLTRVWDNDPWLGRGALGLLLPNLDPLSSRSWAVIIRYADPGHVDDADADKIDPEERRHALDNQVQKVKAARAADGLEFIELLGWVHKPSYDKATRTLSWGTQMRFDRKKSELHYDIRVLGRRGVLGLDVLAEMAQRGLVERQIPDLLKMASFNPGNLYSDFNPSVDRAAHHGVVGLISARLQ
jgi:uncharacterized membrane-anchored protein